MLQQLVINLENFAILFCFNIYHTSYIIFFETNTDKIQIVQTYWFVVIIILSQFLLFLTTSKSSLFSIIFYINHSLMPHSNVTNNDSTKVISCFEQSQKIACSSGFVSFPTLKFCRYIEETTLNRISYCFTHNTKACQCSFKVTPWNSLSVSQTKYCNVISISSWLFSHQIKID